MFSSEANRCSPLIMGLSALFFGVSCTNGIDPDTSGSVAAKGNRPPVITSAKILNDPIVLTGPVAVQINAEDPERETVRFQFQWYVDEAPLPQQTNATLPAGLLRRGQAVSVEITPLDGTQKGQAFRTKSVLVGNTPPSVTAVSLIPQTAQPGKQLDVQVDAVDADHDRVELAYKWFRNGVLIKEGEEPFLDTTGLASRDQIVVEVTAHDPSMSGNSLRSDPLVLGDHAPKIVSMPPASGAQDRYEYAVQAVDPGGGRVTYRLETAPPGMTIDEQTGHILWPVPTGQHGTFHVKVIAQNGGGAAAYQEFDLTLADPVPATKPVGS